MTFPTTFKIGPRQPVSLLIFPLKEDVTEDQVSMPQIRMKSSFGSEEEISGQQDIPDEDQDYN